MSTATTTTTNILAGQSYHNVQFGLSSEKMCFVAVGKMLCKYLRFLIPNYFSESEKCLLMSPSNFTTLNSSS